MNTYVRDSVFWLVAGLLSLLIIDCTALPGLVGVVNKCKNAEIWVGKPGATDARRILAGQRAEFKPINIPDTSANEQGHKFDRSLELIIRKPGATTEWKVQIAQIDATGNQLTIKAQTADGTKDSTTQVTTAVNSAYILGLPASPWQGVVIAFKDVAVADETVDIPFTFALSAWASNINPWYGADDGSHFLKINKTADGSVQFKDKAGKPQYLTIIQGQQALGGGVVPRPNHAHFVHIYNNTARALDMKRSLGGGAGDSIIIPPQSVVPYIMEWVPVRKNKDANLVESSKPVIRFALVRRAKSLDVLKPDENLISGAAGITALPTEADVNDILTKMGLSTSGTAASIMGTKSIEQLMKPEGTTQWNVSSIVYKIFADEDRNIHIISYDYSKDDATDVEVPISTDPAYVDYTHPGYFALVVTESSDVSNPITFKLINLKTIEKPYIYQ